MDAILMRALPVQNPAALALVQGAKLRELLVILQIALSLVLLISTALFVRSLEKARAIEIREAGGVLPRLFWRWKSLDVNRRGGGLRTGMAP